MSLSTALTLPRDIFTDSFFCVFAKEFNSPAMCVSSRAWDPVLCQALPQTFSLSVRFVPVHQVTPPPSSPGQPRPSRRLGGRAAVPTQAIFPGWRVPGYRGDSPVSLALITPIQAHSLNLIARPREGHDGRHAVGLISPPN